MNLPRWALLVLLVPAAALADETIEVSVGERQLFLDDHGIAKIDGLQRTMHQPTKRGAVVKPDVPSDGNSLELRAAPIWDETERVYKMFYMAMPMDDHPLIGMALAVSKDGLHWDKPDWGQQIKIRGSTKNNRIAVEHKPGVRDTFFLNVVYDLDDPDVSRRYKALYGDEYRLPVVSPDGIRWTKLAVPRLASEDESSLVYDRKHRRFLAWLKTGNKYGRAHSLAISQDVWDRVQMFATEPLVRDDELWIYYCGLKWRCDPYIYNSDRSSRDLKSLSAEERADQAEGMGAICLAVLRRDGFVSLDAGETAGTITTKPFKWSGSKLMANVEAREPGELQAAVLDTEGAVIATSQPLTGNQPRGEFRWSPALPQSLHGQQVSLRFTLREASFYSWWLK